MKELNERLDQVKEEMRLHKKWSGMLEILNGEIQSAEEKLELLRREMSKEARDVEKLEGWTVTGLLLAMSGKKEERLQCEKEEAVKAKLRFDEWKLTVKEHLQEKEELSGKLEKLGRPEHRYELLLQTKEKLIHDSSSPLSQLLFNLSEQSSEYKAQWKEVKEAKDAAAMALSKLEQAEGLLGSAKNWGMLDIAGEDLISTFAKRSKMDDAQRSLHEAQRHLKKLEKELADLNMESVESIKVSGLLNMTDMFFDNIFSDLMVQDKINRTISRVTDTKSKLRSLSSRLEKDLTKLSRQIEETEEKKRRHVEETS